jgi:hypothetical protein
MTDRLKCPSCGIPTVEDSQQDITEEEATCDSCHALDEDVKAYTAALNSSPNAWGQHIVGGVQSHAFLRIMYERYGTESVVRALDSYYRENT